MWTIIVRAGMMLSTLMIGKQVVDHFWPAEIHPTRLYRVGQIARYLGTTQETVLALVEKGDLKAHWGDNEPRIPGSSVLEFLARTV